MLLLSKTKRYIPVFITLAVLPIVSYMTMNTTEASPSTPITEIGEPKPEILDGIWTFRDPNAEK